ncbi:protein MIGRI [Chitinibacteraceae bacterium HSL-7]
MIPRVLRSLLWIFAMSGIIAVALAIFFPRLRAEVDRAVRIAAVVLVISGSAALIWHALS